MPFLLDVKRGTHRGRVDRAGHGRALAGEAIPEIAIRYWEWRLAGVAGSYRGTLASRVRGRAVHGHSWQRVRGGRGVALERNGDEASSNHHVHVGFTGVGCREIDDERHLSGRADLQRVRACRTRRAGQGDRRKRKRDSGVDGDRTTSSTGTG